MSSGGWRRSLRSKPSPLSLLALLLVLLLPLQGWAEAPSALELERALDQILRKAVSERRVAGCVVLVAHQGTVVYREAMGLADLESERKMQLDTLFRLASVSKPMVSAAAMKLVEQGRLSLDDPVTRWLPEFRPALADGRQPETTVRQLLTHTSGLTYGFNQPLGGSYDALLVSDGLDNPSLTLEENLRRLAQAPLEREPGSGFIYSLSTDVLGAIIEKVTGKSLPDAVDELVLVPLDMRDTGFWAKDPTRLAEPYSNSGDELRRITDGLSLPLAASTLSFAPSKGLRSSPNPSGGGGMVGSAPDFLLFLERLRQGGGPILKATTAALMTQD